MCLENNKDWLHTKYCLRKPGHNHCFYFYLAIVQLKQCASHNESNVPLCAYGIKRHNFSPTANLYRYVFVNKLFI